MPHCQNLYYGNSGDSMYSHNGLPFSTFDVDNDNRSTVISTLDTILDNEMFQPAFPDRILVQTLGWVVPNIQMYIYMYVLW